MFARSILLAFAALLAVSTAQPGMSGGGDRGGGGGGEIGGGADKADDECATGSWASGNDAKKPGPCGALLFCKIDISDDPDAGPLEELATSDCFDDNANPYFTITESSPGVGTVEPLIPGTVIDKVIVKAGNGYCTYEDPSQATGNYLAPAKADTPTIPRGVSHVTVCYSEPPPCMCKTVQTCGLTVYETDPVECDCVLLDVASPTCPAEDVAEEVPGGRRFF